MARPIIFHPFLFASFASLSLVANNILQLAGSGARAVVLALMAAGIVMLVARLLIKDRIKAGLIASAAIVLFFSYGHVLNLLEPRMDSSGVLVASWILLFAGWTWLVLRRVQKPETISNALNLISAVANIVPIITIVSYSASPVSRGILADSYFSESIAGMLDAQLEIPENPPDVFYIVLDAYARADVLARRYGYDNSKFLGQLADRGFQIGETARANYTHSEISMASSLNMSHVDNLPGFLREHSEPSNEGEVRAIASDLIRLSTVRSQLEAVGYTSVAYDSGYILTNMDTAALFIQSPDIDAVSTWQLGLEFMLLDTTLGREVTGLLGEDLSPHRRLFDAHRERVLFTLGNLATYAEMEGDYFVFAHVISPHVPFVFGANGEEITGIDAYTLLDAGGGNEANIGLYRDQLHYLNSQVLAAIDAILDKSDVPPIIVLQSDHGSKVFSESDPPRPIKMDLFVPILNAIHAPGVELYSGMTPANTFRVILNQLFGAEFELTEDTTYLLEQIDGRWEFVDACAQYAACPDLLEAADG
jgi:hypothetical protein